MMKYVLVVMYMMGPFFIDCSVGKEIEKACQGVSAPTTPPIGIPHRLAHPLQGCWREPSFFAQTFRAEQRAANLRAAEYSVERTALKQDTIKNDKVKDEKIRNKQESSSDESSAQVSDTDEETFKIDE